MKKVIISAILLLTLGGFGYYKYDSYKNPKNYDVKTDSIKEPAKTLDNVVARVQTQEANIIVDNPIGGIYKGVIEVGASGFNSFVVNIDNQKRWELVDKQFGESLAYEGFITTDDVKLGLKKYLASMFQKGVAGRNAHFVVSSGALKNPKTELIIKSIEQMGYVVNKVTAEQEGKYALKALLPSTYRTNGFVVDIGSGNTKVSWYDGDKLKTIEAPGAKYYQNNMTNEEAYNKLSSAIDKVPSNLRENCFLIGGTPFSLAKNNKSTNRYTLLASPDSYSAGTDVKLKSGINLYRAIYDKAQSKQYIFDWDANFTIGFLMSLN